MMPRLLKEARKSARPSGTPGPQKSSEALGETYVMVLFTEHLTTARETVVEGIPGTDTAGQGGILKENSDDT